MTANCVPVVAKDVPATNGIVHVVEDLLPTVTHGLEHLVSQNPQLTQLNQGTDGINLAHCLVIVIQKWTLYKFTHLKYWFNKTSLICLC